MNANPLALEDFGVFAGPVPIETVSADRLEAEKLGAFDKGYAAGWEDASAACEQAHAEGADAALARLQDVSFTFHEARAQILRSFLPLVEAITSRVVPAALQATLGARLTELVETTVADATTAEVRLLAAPGEGRRLESALAGRVSFPVAVREDESLAAGLVHLRVGQSEHEIDLAGFESRLSEALAALDTALDETSRHG
jgi:hypothetical protein